MEHIRKLPHSVWGVLPPILVMYAAAFGGNVAGLIYEENKVFSMVLLALVVPLAFRHTSRPPIVILLTAQVAVMCVSMLVSPSYLGAWLVLLWVGVVITFWISEAVPIAQLERAMMAVIAALALIALYDVIEWWFQSGLPLARPIRPSSALSNPNIVAPVMMIGIAIALYTRRLVWLAVFMIALVFTGSRATFLGMAVGTVVLMAIRMPRPQLTRTHIFIGAAFASVLVSLFIFQFRSPLDGLDLRADLWRVAVITFRQYPLVGIGPERYRTALLALALAQHTVIHTHAHNTYLQIAAELGAMGLLTSGGILAAAMLRIRQTFHAGNKQGAAIAAALLAGFLIQGLLDYVYWVLALVLMTLWAGRILVTPRSPDVSNPPGMSRWRLAITVALVLLGYPAILLAHHIDRRMGWLYQCTTGTAFLLACAFYATMPAASQAAEPAALEPPGTSHR